MHLSHNLLQALEPHGEVVIIIQVVQALLVLPLIVPVVAAAPHMTMAVPPPQISTTPPTQHACTPSDCHPIKHVVMCVETCPASLMQLL